jgi:hypothetical protein
VDERTLRLGGEAVATALPTPSLRTSLGTPMTAQGHFRPGLRASPVVRSKSAIGPAISGRQVEVLGEGEEPQPSCNVAGVMETFSSDRLVISPDVPPLPFRDIRQNASNVQEAHDLSRPSH